MRIFMQRVNEIVLLAVAVIFLFVMNGCRNSQVHSAAEEGHPASAEEIVENHEVAADEPVVVESSSDNTYQSIKRTIVIDGRFDDWDGIREWSWQNSKGKSTDRRDHTGFIDLDSDSDSDSEEGGIAVLDTSENNEDSVSVAYDDDWVYLRVGLGGVHNAQGLDGPLSLEFDIDGNPLTGVVETSGDGETAGLPGVDFVLVYSPVNAKSGKSGGVGAFALEQGMGRTAVNPYDIQASFLPTYADNKIEIRLRRGVEIPGTNVESFMNHAFSFQSVRTTATGDITEQTAPVTVMINQEGESGDSSASSTVADALAGGRWMRKPGGSVRIMSWNIEVGHMFDDPEPFARVIRAVRPDVICFQEMGRGHQGADLKRWLAKEAPVAEGWDVRMRLNGDVAIATRLASVRTGPSEMPAIAGGKYPVRAEMSLIGYGGTRIIVSSVHLKCCGRAGDRSDNKRIAEAGVIHEVLGKSVAEDNAVGIVVMGDLNLVGSRTPLDDLMKGADLDGSDLLDVAPLRLYDSTSTTWRDRNQPYLPARLDFALVSDTTVRVVDSFVFDSALLSDGELAVLELDRGDCNAASDHLPVVIDVIW